MREKPKGWYSEEEKWLLLENPYHKDNDFVHAGYLLINKFKQTLFTSAYEIVK
ncbi:hypothetical protein [Bacillus sp. OV322]|uniref:hypothetical protein n=1 Tax=Bacillus sp. OV322 TaxID=1882764 RepID=UPI0015A6DEBE|nr:hypothetical protein [Bacillus sp. OV322]